MDISIPLRSVIPSAQADVLMVLAGTSESLTGRRVADLTEGAVSQKSVSLILNDLVHSGIVLREIHGSAFSHTLNREHLAFDAIVALATTRGRLIEKMTELIAGWDIPPAAVWLFGSAARGDGTEESDIDIFVVRDTSVHQDDPAWETQVDRLGDRVSAWTGNACQIVEYSTEEVTTLAHRGEALILSVRAEGILIAGERTVLAYANPTRTPA